MTARPALPDRLAAALETPLVGRREPLARLQAELRRARAGESPIVLVTGEGGIGKTRLIAEVANAAGDFAVLYGRCDEDQLFPFGPWIEMLGGALARVADAELPALLGAEGPELARLLPELRGRVPGLAAPGPSDPESELRHLYTAVVAMCPAITAGPRSPGSLPGSYQPVLAKFSGVSIVLSGSRSSETTRALTPTAGMRIRRGGAASRSTTSTSRRCAC